MKWRSTVRVTFEVDADDEAASRAELNRVAPLLLESIHGVVGVRGCRIDWPVLVDVEAEDEAVHELLYGVGAK